MSVTMTTDQILATINLKLDMLPKQIDQIVDDRVGQLERKFDQKLDDIAATQKAEFRKLSKCLTHVQDDVGIATTEVARLVNLSSLNETKTKKAVLEVNNELSDKVGDLRQEVTNMKDEILHQMIDLIQDGSIPDETGTSENKETTSDVKRTQCSEIQNIVS